MKMKFVCAMYIIKYYRCSLMPNKDIIYKVVINISNALAFSRSLKDLSWDRMSCDRKSEK